MDRKDTNGPKILTQIWLSKRHAAYKFNRGSEHRELYEGRFQCVDKKYGLTAISVVGHNRIVTDENGEYSLKQFPKTCPQDSRCHEE